MMNPLTRLPAECEDGAITILALFLVAAVAGVLGLSLDVSNAYKVRTELQVAADAASHAALYNRGVMSADGAKTQALTVVGFNLENSDGAGSVMDVADIDFGLWDHETRTFVEDTSSKTAVRVSAVRHAARDNAVGTYLLDFVGLKSWDVSAQSVAVTYRPKCLTEGFVADNVVDIQSNNGFYNGFCLHANNYISVNQNNYFEAGTVVSMPNSENIDLPASGFEMNEGLEDALRDAFYQVRVVNRIDTFMTAIKAGDPEYLPDYITDTSPIYLAGKDAVVDDFTHGRIHILSCNVGNKFTLKPGTYSSVVMFASCPVTFSNGVILEDVVIGNSSTAAKSFYSSAGLQIGRNDDCAAGGGAQLMTLGGMEFAADLKVYGGQLLAVGDIQFASNADGLEGVSMVSAHDVTGTSNMTMGFCNNGMEANFEVDYYRIVG